MSNPVAVQRQYPAKGIPAANSMRQWVAAAREQAEGAVALRIVDEDESQQLNHQFRKQNKPTNVLSFPAQQFEMPENSHIESELGDIILCAPVIKREAQQQQKPARAHWAHMVVHGVLHLRGFDHQNEKDATIMESLERRILASLGFGDPYAADTH